MAFNSAPSIAVVILNWNGKHFLDQFLPGVIQHSPGCEIVVADNASTDDSVAFLESNFPEVRVIKLPINLGFCGGYNESLKEVQADYFVLLNSDIEVTPNWVEPIISLMESDKTIGACQPKIKDFNRKEYFEYAGAAGGYIDSLGYPFCRGRLFDTLEKDEGQYNDVREVFWATGACMFVRAEAFRKMGGLESSFFAHMEEIDLCWRLQNAGYKICYLGGSEVYHVGGGTLHKSNPRKTYLNFRNGLSLLYRNLNPAERNGKIFKRMVLDGIAGVQFLTKGKKADFDAILKAHADFKKVRKAGVTAEGHQKLFKELTGTYSGSIVWDYFGKKKKMFRELKGLE